MCRQTGFQLQSGWFVSPEQFEQFRRYQVYPGDVQYVKAVSNQDWDAQQQTLTLVGRLATMAGAMPSAGKEDSLFEAEVRDALTALGHTTLSQIGESGFRIDLAVVHPNPERGYVLGMRRQIVSFGMDTAGSRCLAAAHFGAAR